MRMRLLGEGGVGARCRGRRLEMRGCGRWEEGRAGPRALWLPGTLVSVDAAAGGRAVGEDAADEASDEAAPRCR